MATKNKLCPQCNLRRAPKFYKTERARICTPCQRKTAARNAKNYRLQKEYGITIEEYEAMLEAQGGACAICGRTPRYPLDVDHDHYVEKHLLRWYSPLTARRMSIRGLLDKPCNRRLLPAAKDDPIVLQAALTYIKQPPATGIIRARKEDRERGVQGR